MTKATAAAQRRYITIIRSDADSTITASTGVNSESIPVQIQTSPKRQEMLKQISEQPWMQQVKQEHREDIARLFAGMDDKRLHFWEKYGKLIKGDLYYPKESGFHRQDQVFLNLSESDIRSKTLGYDCNIRVFLHESGHLLDYHQQNDQIKFALYGDGEIIHLRNGVSDIMEGLTEGKLKMPYGHHKTPDYWVTHSVSTEAIAHLLEAYMNGGQKYQEFIRYFPKTMRYFEDYMNQLM